MAKSPNAGCRPLPVSVFLLVMFACCGLVGAAEAGGGAGLQSSDTFGVGERISTFPADISAFSCSIHNPASMVFQGGIVTATIGATGRIQCSDYAYTCDTSFCEIVDQVVTQGMVRRESTGGGTNRPPRATGSVPAQTLTAGGSSASVNVARYFTDPDGDRLTYTARSSRTGVVRASVSGSTLTLSPVSAGTAAVTVTARDPDGASATQSIAVTVEEGGGANRPPRPTGSIPAQTLRVGGVAASVDAARYFTDPDGDALTYSASSNRSRIVRAGTSGSTVTLTPVAAGAATVTVAARDPDGASATQAISVTVEDEGGAMPLWSSTLTAASFETTSGTRFMGYMRTEGEDGVRQRGELSDRGFDFRGTAHHVPFLAQNRNTGFIVLRVGPPLDEQDVDSMTLTVDGHALAASDATVFPDSVFGGMRVMSILLDDPGVRWSDGQHIAVQLHDGAGPGSGNQAPRATGSVPAQTLTVGGRSASVNVARYFLDPDGDALTYSASSSRTGVVTAAASGSTVTLTPVAAGTATVTVTARDPGGGSATQSIAVTVRVAGTVNGFTDDPLVTGVTPVRAVHFQELRARIDALRTGAGLPAYAWTDRVLTPRVTLVRSVHLTELRAALNEAYAAAGQPRPAYTDAGVRAGTTPIRAAHVTELRNAVVELENAAPTGLMPDLVVAAPTVSDRTLTSGQSFTLSATVRNRGSARAAATTLRYYRSTDSTISTNDAAVGTDAVSALAADASGTESISLTAPSSAGTYYYGACVEPVGGESDTGNNCSSGVRVTVESGGGGEALTGEITTCSGTRTAGTIVNVVIAGTVTAQRPLSLVTLTGRGNGDFVGIQFIGSMSAGRTENFRIAGIISTSASTLRCTIEADYRVSGARETIATISVSETGPVR